MDKRFWDHIDTFANSEGFAFFVFFLTCMLVLGGLAGIVVWLGTREGKDG